MAGLGTEFSGWMESFLENPCKPFKQCALWLAVTPSEAREHSPFCFWATQARPWPNSLSPSTGLWTDIVESCVSTSPILSIILKAGVRVPIIREGSRNSETPYDLAKATKLHQGWSCHLLKAHSVTLPFLLRSPQGAVCPQAEDSSSSTVPPDQGSNLAWCLSLSE